MFTCSLSGVLGRRLRRLEVATLLSPYWPGVAPPPWLRTFSSVETLRLFVVHFSRSLPGPRL